MFFTEDTFEQAVIELFEGMGYTHIYAPDMNRTDYSSPLLDSVLQDSLVRINKGQPLEAIQEGMKLLLKGNANAHASFVINKYEHRHSSCGSQCYFRTVSAVYRGDHR